MTYLQIVPLGKAFWMTLFLLEAISLWELWTANEQERFTRGQMKLSEKTPGLPYMYHAACMWSVPFIMNPLFAYLIQLYWTPLRHRPELVLAALFIGWFVAVKLVWSWARNGMNEAHVELPSRVPSLIGTILMGQIALMTAILALTLLMSVTKEPRIFFGTVLVCVFHFSLATHWPLRFKKLSWTPRELRAMGQIGRLFSFVTILALFYGIFLIVTVGIV